MKKNKKVEEVGTGSNPVQPMVMRSSDYEYGTIEYFHARVIELEKERNTSDDEAEYYREELVKAHTLIGRITHQLSERWDSVNLTKYYPTDNLHKKRNIKNPKGA